jgi:alginate O-acetyltransferase complex protein AlgI
LRDVCAPDVSNIAPVPTIKLIVVGKSGQRNRQRQHNRLPLRLAGAATRWLLLFSSYQFAVFFAVVFTTYWLLPWSRARVWLLLVASFFFYASWNKWLALLICVSSALDYGVARGMEAFTSSWKRKLLLISSLVANLGLLAYFKYANFFLDSLREAVRATGNSLSLPVLQVILPVGISFYTFEAINYTVDVYRRRIPAERNLAHFMLFITFFPHLVAGPIVRARDFLPQIRRRKRWDWGRLQLGTEYFLMGLVKKLVVADRMALYADPVFASPEQYSGAAVWLAVVAYALQIYCDFSGYSDMALGSAHMLGYKLVQNFNMPYIARNISEFWHRWHISLSTWLRDYLFIPLGGSRGSEWKTSRNLLITMTLGGLWHGASWTFVVWGVMHGLFLIVHRAFTRFARSWSRLEFWLHTALGTALCTALTLLSVCVGWVFFRCQTFAAALTMLGKMAWPGPGAELPLETSTLFATLALVVVCHVVVATGLWKRLSYRLPAPAWGLGYSVAIALVLAQTMASAPGRPFIYFQF